MLENLIFSLNRVIPFFLLILLGVLLRQGGVLPQDFFQGLNRFMFRVALPCSLFLSIYRIDWSQNGNLPVIPLLAGATIASFLFCWLLMELICRDKSLVGTMVQGSFRGNYALLGMPLVITVIGEEWRPLASLAMAAIIPLYGALSLLVLNVRGADTNRPRLSPLHLVGEILRNPLVCSSLLGLAFGLLRIPLPQVLESTAGYLAPTATPLGLLSIGGIFDWKLAGQRMKPALIAAATKVLVLPVLAASVAWALGVRGEFLFFLFAIFANPTAVASYTVSVTSNGDGPLAANIVIITTLSSAFTLATGIYVMRSLGWI